MRKFLISAGVAFMLAAQACTTTPLVPPTAAQTLTLDSQRALYVAELAYQAFTTGTEVAINSHSLTPAQLAQAQAIDRRAYAALLAARAGQATAMNVLNILSEGAH